MDERVTLEFFALPSRQAIKQEAFSLSLVTVLAGKAPETSPVPAYHSKQVIKAADYSRQSEVATDT
jgi:hypothetical protein